MSYGEDLINERLANEASDAFIIRTLFKGMVEESVRRNDTSRLYGALVSKKWITNEGTAISIREMDGLHIRNCISMLKRNLPYYADGFDEIARGYITLFENELQKRYSPRDAAEGFFNEKEDEFIAQSLL